MKNLTLKIPLIHIALITGFIVITAQIIKDQTEDIYGELFKYIYTVGYLLDNTLLNVLFVLLVFIPLPLLGISILKKRRDLIIGFSISSMTSIILLLLINF